MNDSTPIGIMPKMSIPYEMFEGWMVTALEGGSNYWYWLQDNFLNDEIMKKYENEPFSIRISKAIWHDNASVEVFDYENEDEVLGEINLPKVKSALESICVDYPHIFSALLDDYDANDADVFFQVAVMGEVVFG